MAEVMLMRGANSTFVPADEQSRVAMQSIRMGTVVKARVTQPRSLKFHKRFFALLNLGFEHWEPPEQEWRGIRAVKSFEVYREQVIILAGYRDVTYNLDGSVKVTARSVSFANMDETAFRDLYRSVFSVIWKYIISRCHGWTEAEMERVLGQMEVFA